MDRVDVTTLKSFAEKGRVPSALKFLLAHEKDWMTPEEFCAKVGVWLLLFDMDEVND